MVDLGRRFLILVTMGQVMRAARYDRAANELNAVRKCV